MVLRRLVVALVPLVLAVSAPSPAGAAFGYLDQFGSPGTGDGQFQDPAGLSAANGELLVADRINLRVQRFNPDTKAFIGKFGTTGGPADVTFDPASGSPNNLLTVDFPNDRIRRFTWNGTPTGLPSTFAATDPDGVAVSTGGTIFVSNTATDQIDRFDGAGTLLGSWGGPGSGNGQFADPSRLTFDLSGNLLVADKANNRIQKLNGTTGAHMLTIGGAGQLNQPEGVAVDLTGNIVVADTGNNRIRRYQSDGTAIDTYGEAGSGNGQFSSPSDVFVPGNGKVYVADELNNRVQILGEGGSPPGVLLPIVTTGAAEGLTRSGARLTGTVNPQGVATDYRFEYGTTTSYGSTTAATAVGSGSADVAAAATITGLTPATTYHYRLVALRGGSVAAVGADRSLTTPDPGTATGCARDGHTIGVVAVCADAITSTGSGTWRASGNVTLNTGVVVGGDLDLDDTQQLITSGAGVSIGVNRGGVVNWGTGRLQIDTNAATDPVSGRTGLAKVTVFDFTRIVQATFGGLTMGFLGTSNEYLDAADGGGLILSVKPNFDLGAFVNVQPVGSFSLGIHATPSSEFRLLGGSIGWNGINLPGGWKIGLLKLEYQSATSAWAFTGGAEITGVGGLEISGGILGGRLDRLGVKVSTPGVPLGQTGIVLDTFGGSISGLANGPLVISALTAGGWTPTGAPQPFNWILHIKDVTLTIDTSGSGTLSGGVAVLDGEGRLASGTISFTIGISPFIASGDLDVLVQAALFSVNFDASAAMNRSHFTGSGTARGKFAGINVGSATGIISDVGAGASARFCFFSCWSIGAGLRWANVTSWPPAVDLIGADTEQYRTISASAAGSRAGAAANERRFTVEAKRPLLYVTAHAQNARTKFELIAPDGTRYGLRTKRRGVATEVYEGGKVSAIAIWEPRPGTWRLREIDAPKARVKVQVARQIGRLRARTLRPTGTVKQPLSRKKTKSVRATWRWTGQPASTRVDIYVSSTKKGQGTRIKRNLRRTDSYRIPIKALKHRTNWVSVVARAEGVAFQRATYRVPVRVR